MDSAHATTGWTLRRSSRLAPRDGARVIVSNDLAVNDQHHFCGHSAACCRAAAAPPRAVGCSSLARVRSRLFFSGFKVLAFPSPRPSPSSAKKRGEPDGAAVLQRPRLAPPRPRNHGAQYLQQHVSKLQLERSEVLAPGTATCARLRRLVAGNSVPLALPWFNKGGVRRQIFASLRVLCLGVDRLTRCRNESPTPAQSPSPEECYGINFRSQSQCAFMRVCTRVCHGLTEVRSGHSEAPPYLSPSTHESPRNMWTQSGLRCLLG